MAKKIVFVLSPKTHFLDLAGPDQVFWEAIYFGAPFSLEYCSYAEAAYSSSGLHFAPLPHFSAIELSKGDYVIIPGFDIGLILSGRDAIPADFYAWLQHVYASEVNLCSICTGAFVLARSGVLDHKNCTTHWKYTQQLQTLFPKVKVVENILFTEQERLYTSAGIASGIDLALRIVEKETGAFTAHKVARELVVYIRRSGNQSQQSLYLTYRNHIHAGVHQVQDWLIENLHQHLAIGDLAEIASMSTRNFTRIFKKETGVTLVQYITHLRKEKIKALLKNPNLSRGQIAQKVGLKSERQVNRILFGR